MNNTVTFLNEFMIECFDSLCNIALGNLDPSHVDAREVVHTDIAVYTSEDERSSALKLFAEAKLFEADQFKLFMEEACDIPFGENLLAFDLDNKLEFFRFFYHHYKVKTLGLLIRNKEFNPLYFTGYAEGLAIQFIQDPAKLREKVLNFISQIFACTGMNFEEFLSLPFGEQESYYAEFCAASVIRGQQSLDWEFPSNQFLPVPT